MTPTPGLLLRERRFDPAQAVMRALKDAYGVAGPVLQGLKQAVRGRRGGASAALYRSSAKQAVGKIIDASRKAAGIFHRPGHTDERLRRSCADLRAGFECAQRG